MFFIQFWWFPTYHFIFEVNWKNYWLTSFHRRLFLPIYLRKHSLIFRALNHLDSRSFWKCWSLWLQRISIRWYFFQKFNLKIPNELKSILTLVLVISHGQASVEWGLNTNKSIYKVNQSEKSIMCRKMIIDHVQNTVYYHQPLSSPTSLLSL